MKASDIIKWDAEMANITRSVAILNDIAFGIKDATGFQIRGQVRALAKVVKGTNLKR